MAKVKFYLRADRQRSDGASYLFLVLQNNYERRLFSTNFNFNPADWDKKKSQLKKNAYRAAMLNNQLSRILSEINIELSILEADRIGKNIPFKEYENVVSMYLYGKPINGATVANRFIEFANRKKPSTKDVYLFTLRRLRLFAKNFDELTFEDIDRDWILRFNAWMAETSDSPNYHDIQLRNIRAVFNDAIASGLTENYPFRKIQMKRHYTKKRDLTVERLRTLFDFQCEEYIRPYVDIFKLMFFFCGINVIDLYNLKEISEGRVTFFRSKTGRPYDIKVEPEALAVIERHRGTSALLDIADRYKDHRNYTHRINYNLKKIGPTTYGKRMKVEHIDRLFPEISTYWARHTWASIAADLDIPDRIIGLALGHSEQQTVTDIYIHRNRKKVDEANRKVMDWVLYGIRDGKQIVKPGTPEYYGDYAKHINGTIDAQ